MSIKKIGLLFTVFLLLLSLSVPVAQADELTTFVEQHSNNTLEIINVKDIDNYPDVKEYIRNHGFENNILTGNETNSYLVEKFGLEVEYTESTNPMAQALKKQHGLDRIEPRVYNVDQLLVIEREPKTGLLTTAWSINYVTSDSGLNVTIVIIGANPITRIHGTIYKNENVNGKWNRAVASSSFNKQAVKTGLLHSWKTPKNKVSDSFTYTVTVENDGQRFVYNETEHKYQRYNFAAGAYNSLEALGGERHHFVSRDALTKAKFNAQTAPSIRMMKDDHLLTPNWGRGALADAYRAKEGEFLKAQKYYELLNWELEEFGKLQDPERKFSSLKAKYAPELSVLIDYAFVYFGI